MTELSKGEIEDIKEVFDLFDFWDGRDGLVDAAKAGDFLRSMGLNPTNEIIYKNGGTKKMGEEQYTLEQLIPVYQSVRNEKDTGTFADFMEAFKTFDREGQGYISSAEMRHMLTSLGDRLSDEEMDQIIKMTKIEEDLDGNVKYEEFIRNVLKGPEDVKEVFDLFDFWDGRDGLVDAFKVGDFLRSCGFNPTNESAAKNGGTKKMGETQLKFEELLPIYQHVSKEKDTGTFADFMEAFKTFDREGQGFISSAEMRHVLTSLGERLTDEEVDNIIKSTGLEEDLDGNVKYEDFIKRVMKGHDH